MGEHPSCFQTVRGKFTKIFWKQQQQSKVAVSHEWEKENSFELIENQNKSKESAPASMYGMFLWASAMRKSVKGFTLCPQEFWAWKSDEHNIIKTKGVEIKTRITTEYKIQKEISPTIYWLLTSARAICIHHLIKYLQELWSRVCIFCFTY